MRRNSRRQPPTLWGDFMQVSITGSAIPEFGLLMGFVGTLYTDSYYYMVVGVVLFYAFWWQSIPSRDKWDSWAASASLTLPWDSAAPVSPV